MTYPLKINPTKLRNLLKEGKKQREIAKIFGVAEPSVSIAVKKLKLGKAKNITLSSGKKDVKIQIDAIAQLTKASEVINEIIDGIRKQTKPKRPDKILLMKACDRIESQLKTKLEISKTLYNMAEIVEFRHELIVLLGETSPKLRNDFIRRLKKAKAIRESITFPQLSHDI